LQMALVLQECKENFISDGERYKRIILIVFHVSVNDLN